MAYECLAQLGELGLAQFIDLNAQQKSFQRRFVDYVRSCAEMERRLRFIEMQMRRQDIKVVKTLVPPPAPKPQELEDMATTIQKLELELVGRNKTIRELQAKSLHYIHLGQVLEKTAPYFLQQRPKKEITMLSKSTQTSKELLLKSETEGLENEPLPTTLKQMVTKDNYYTDHKGLKVAICAGIIVKHRVPAFHKMLWRISRGNIFIAFVDIEDSTSKPKCVFLIMFQGEVLKKQVHQICAGFRATLYPCPSEMDERMQLMIEISNYLRDSEDVLQQSMEYRSLLLLAVSSKIESWKLSLWKAKGIYHIMNMFDSDASTKCLVARAWAPEFQIKRLEECMESATKMYSGLKPVIIKIPTLLEPPAYNHVNKYTKAFQIIIDAYGMNSYGEVNPAPFTIITFPFLFSLMFGDVGHGFIITLAAIIMVIWEKKLEDKYYGEIWKILFAGRYIILLMGIFSIYAGLMYNDCFGFGLKLFSTSWVSNVSENTAMNTPIITLDPEIDFKRPHPFGVDLLWHMSQNKITFLNSLKMKMSIIFGVLHIIFGLLLKLWNYLHSKNFLNIIGIFIPQILFFSLIFLYMVVLIFCKWIEYGPHNIKKNIHCAPSILNTIISMMLMSTPKVPENCETYMYSYQDVVQLYLLLTAGACIPWMLFLKPTYLLVQGRAKNKLKYERALLTRRSSRSLHTLHVTVPSLVTQPHWSTTSYPEEISTEGEESTAEVFIYQAIHTLEFVLGSISHTASYLRLWALSLAHSQLTKVLLNMVLDHGLMSDTYMGLNVLILCITFFFWACLTIAILIIMEGLSAFLHTLRLHWVEFQSKFYEGLGYAFTPFYFKTIILESKYKDNQLS